VGCRSGGGDEGCHQRDCCVDTGVDGCWQCERFPCGKGYYVGEEWSGLCVACVELVRAAGVSEYARLVESRLGAVVDYGRYRFKDPKQIKDILLGD
jgi:hypothetical protein